MIKLTDHVKQVEAGSLGAHKLRGTVTIMLADARTGKIDQVIREIGRAHV